MDHQNQVYFIQDINSKILILYVMLKAIIKWFTPRQTSAPEYKPTADIIDEVMMQLPTGGGTSESYPQPAQTDTSHIITYLTLQ